MDNIGIFGGSFDPIHAGHLMVACSLQEKYSLDTVYFVPAQVNPLKNRYLEDKQHRLQMLHLALEGTGFSVSTLELDRPPPSYMIDTVNALIERQKAHYFLLLGSDLLDEITKWKSYQKLLTLAKPLIARRRRDTALSENWQNDASIRELIAGGITETCLFDISSTMIRERLQAGRFCGHLLDKDVYRYIKQHKLYGCA